MSLLIDIRDAAIDANVPIATLLRKCAVLAANLNHEALRAWAMQELNGYAADAALPQYRVVVAPASGHLAGPWNSGYRGITIPASLLPEGVRVFAEEVRLRQPIAAIETLCRIDENKGELTCPWPGDLIALMQDKIAQGMALYGAWQSVSKASLVGLVDSVRNRILEFAIELIREAPTAGESAAAAGAIAPERVTYLFQTIIQGNVSGTVVAGHAGSVETNVVIHAGDLAALKAALGGYGLPAREVTDLEAALQADRAEGQELGTNTSRWIDRLTGQVSSGAIKLGGGVATAVIVKAILAYLGIG